MSNQNISGAAGGSGGGGGGINPNYYANFGTNSVEKTGMEKLKEVFQLNQKPTPPPSPKKALMSKPSKVSSSHHPNPGCTHHWQSAGIRSIQASMDSEVVLFCVHCGDLMLRRVPYNSQNSGVNASQGNSLMSAATQLYNPYKNGTGLGSTDF